MTARWAEPDALRRMLAMDTWAVVGLSDDRSRPAWEVASFLQRRGKRIFPVHPAGGETLGVPILGSLDELPVPVDVVDVFRRSQFAGAHADEAVRVGAKAVWFQVGVVDEAAYARTRAAGLDMVMDTCPKIEWAAYGPG